MNKLLKSKDDVRMIGVPDGLLNCGVNSWDNSTLTSQLWCDCLY